MLCISISLFEQKRKYGWEFLFLAANIDAVETAEHYGINAERAVNYKASSTGTVDMYACVSEAITDIRSGGGLKKGWGKSLETKYTRTPEAGSPASGVLYSLLASFRPGQVVAHVEQRAQYVVWCAAVKCDGEPVFLVHVICGENAASALKRCH